MPYREIKGDLFEVDSEKWVLAHCISADVTETDNMNRGIAKIFRKKNPEMAKEISPKLEVGKAIRYQKSNVVIYNLVSKEKVWQKVKGKNEQMYYSQLKEALIDMKEQMIKAKEKSLAMPKIASGLDGGDWNFIREMILTVFSNTDIEIQICYIDEPI